MRMLHSAIEESGSFDEVDLQAMELAYVASIFQLGIGQSEVDRERLAQMLFQLASQGERDWRALNKRAVLALSLEHR